MPRRQVKNAALPSHHLTIVIVISISAPSASPRPAKRRDPPIEGWQRRRWRKKQKKKKHIYWRLWQQRVKSFGLLSYSVPAPGCGWCYFWRGRGEASATCAAAQGVAVKGWSASGWLTDWLCRCQAIASYMVFYCIPFCSPGSTLFQLSCFPCDCSRFVAFRGQLQFVVFGILVCFWVGFGFRLDWVRLGYHHDHGIAQEPEQQQHALKKQANNEANLFLFFFFYYYVFFWHPFFFFLRLFLGLLCFFHVTEATALYYKTLEIFNMNLPFFLVIYNIILTVFCLIVFSDPIIVSPTPGAALSLRDLQDRKKLMENDNKKTSRAWKCFVRNGIKISLTKCFIWMAKACYTPRSLPRKNMRLSLLLQENFVFFSRNAWSKREINWKNSL